MRSLRLPARLTELANANRGAASLVPLGAVVVLALLLLGASIWQAAARVDGVQLASERRLVDHALRGLAESLARSAAGLARDAGFVSGLAAALDPASPDAPAIVARPPTAEAYEYLFVVGPDGATRYGRVGDARTDAAAEASLGPGLAALTARPDRREVATGVLATPGGLVAVAVAPLAADGPGGPVGLLVVGERIDAPLLAALLGSLGIQAPRPAADGALQPGEAATALRAPDGTVAASVAWFPGRPGSQQLADLTPAVLSALFVFLSFAALALDNVRRSVARLGASEARFRDVAQAGSDWIWETDAALQFTFLSDHFARATGMAREAALGQPLEAVLHAGSETEQAAAIARREAFRDAVCRLEAPGSPPRTLRVVGTPVRGRDGAFAGYRGAATDITAEVEAVAQARYLAAHDALTDLPNRIRLHEALAEAANRWDRYATQAAVLCIDLDGFKEVNDTLGHPAGDQLLRACAERLRNSVRQLDLVARLGGDEFAILMSDIKGPADVEALCERVIATVAEPFGLDGHDIIVTASVGAALLPADAELSDRLMQNADIALYRAKAEGRNRFRFFEPAMEERLRQRKFVEAGLRAALARGQLELYYQPQVATRSGELLGYEALLRWRHPERGVISPMDFIPIAEETGLIIPIGAWVIRQACRDLARLPGLRVSVNISPVQFRQRELVDIVRETLAETGIDPELLELEITESVLIGNVEEALETLSRLRALRVRLVMDDFGTGYSSLSYLQKFTFDKLKVDKSFIRELAQDGSKRAIVRAMVDLGQGLGMETCAEGVETEEQLRLLAEEGCTEVQGFLFGRPQPRDSLSLPAAEQDAAPEVSDATAMELAAASATSRVGPGGDRRAAATPAAA